MATDTPPADETVDPSAARGSEATAETRRRPTEPPPLRSRRILDGTVLVADGVDNAVRWHEGERLEDLFERRVDSLDTQGHDELAVDGPAGRLTYAELDARANQLARHLGEAAGVQPGARVALLLDDPILAYTAMLAVLKRHAAYVPLDSGFPPDRLAYIVGDSGAELILTTSDLDGQLAEVDEGVQRLALDTLAGRLDGHAAERLEDAETGEIDDGLAYLIYTSGTTGRPKGVAITHASAVNFIRVAAEVYGIRADDRIYQGLTIAFDFAVEEIWVAWAVGATLVPKPSGGKLLGPELSDFLTEHEVTALCCVPTLLATLEGKLPGVRFLLVSGESCPQDLVERWSREGRRFLNVYGPTEATVIATWTELSPGQPVTIGVPLPTYAVAILDPDEARARELGEEGEIAVAGIALAEGYLNRPEKTEEAFIDDFLEIPDNPSGRLYRTGDLGRVNDDGEIEHHGRIDTQVKIRGYRIELDEIESVLREAPGVGQGVISTHSSDAGDDELVAYFAADGPVDEDALHDHLREKLPAYMVPAFYERLEEIPLMPSGKADRKQLPAPSGQRRVSGSDDTAAEGELEALMAKVMAQVLGVEQVGVQSDFFEELGASSLLMARFDAELREAGEVPPLSMRDVYTHPTIRRLAAAIGGGEAGGTGGHPVPEISDPEQPEPIGTPHYVLCGVLQLLAFLAYAALAGVAFDLVSAWLTAAPNVLDGYLRALASGGALLTGVGLTPILAKWLLIGRFGPVRIRVWSLPYVRFWIVKTLILSNPAARLVRGTALYRLYLRALGARIEPGALVLTEHVPICTDLIEVGAGAIIRKDTYLNGYRARDGVIEIGPVHVGRGAFVGELSVLDIHTEVGDGAAVGHSSSVQAGQTVPAGQTWWGSPVEPAGAGVEYRTVPEVELRRVRRWGFNLSLGLLAGLVLAPAEVGITALLLAHPADLVGLSTQDGIWIGAGLVLGAVLAGLIVAGLLPRLASRWLPAGRVYPLYGPRHLLARIVRRTSNLPLLTRLFGDSAAIVGYLRYLGWQMDDVVQTGSNFGLMVEQEVPARTRVGGGTMVSDGLSVMNTEYSASAFRVADVEIGAGCFLGNRIGWPAGARTGDNLLIGTKAMVPVAGPVRSDTGLLGSPCFEIPRTVEDDERVTGEIDAAQRPARLRAKARHNLVTGLLYLVSRILFVAALVVLAVAPLEGWGGTLLSEVVELAGIPVVFLAGAEILAGGRRLAPQTVSVIDPAFWRHERFWKLQSEHYLRLFDGTPFKGLVWRLLGVRVGPRLFDDGAGIVERSLTSLGADVTLNMGVELQAHSLENGVFKSDRITVGDRATIGVAALVNYDARIGERAVVDADAFVMKGSALPAGARWRGNPASEVRS